MAIRKKQEPSEYQKALRKFHKKSNRHVVVFEADISENEKRRIFSDADHLRQCGNELLGIMKRNLEQLLRTKRYRVLQKLYGKVSDRRKCGRRTVCSRVSLLRNRCVCQSPCDVRRHQNFVNGTPVACCWVKSDWKLFCFRLLIAGIFGIARQMR